MAVIICEGRNGVHTLKRSGCGYQLPNWSRHKDVHFEIRKPTFTLTTMNDWVGSILVVQVGLQAPHWMTGSGY
jgi:hypothetical protein